MSLPITVPADFVNTKPYAISQDTFVTRDLTSYIPTLEPRYLRQLLSDGIYQRIKDNNPLKLQDTALIAATDYTDRNGTKRTSEGFKKVLLYIVYAQFISDNWINTPVGNVRNLNENSTLVAKDNVQIVNNRYNEGARLYNEDIQRFLCDFGTVTGVFATSVDNADNTYNVTVDGTPKDLTTNTLDFLDVGDTITIGGTDFTVLTIVSPLSFTFDGGSTGLNFVGSTYSFINFEEYSTKLLEYSWL